MCSGSEAGSYLRLIDSCITQLKAQGPSRTSNESKEEASPFWVAGPGGGGVAATIARISHYRGTSLIRKRLPLGPYTRTMPRDMWWP